MASQDPAEKRHHWEQALTLFTEVGTPERHDVAERLRSVVAAAELVDGVRKDRRQHG